MLVVHQVPVLLVWFDSKCKISLTLNCLFFYLKAQYALYSLTNVGLAINPVPVVLAPI